MQGHSYGEHLCVHEWPGDQHLLKLRGVSGGPQLYCVRAETRYEAQGFIPLLQTR